VRSTDLIDKRIGRKAYNVSMNEVVRCHRADIRNQCPEEEKKILQGIVKFGDIEVKEIMRSRVDLLRLSMLG
jgi:putative hemolysin